MEKDKIKNFLVFFPPVLLAVTVMLPRLLTPDFSLFDDGRIMLILRELTHHINGLQREYQDGRFTPVYWLVFGIPYILFGTKPFWFLVTNLILLIFTNIAVVYFVIHQTGNKVQGLLSGILFILAGPVIENYYTISKSEPLQVFWLILSLVAWSLSTRARGRKAAILFLLTTLFVLLANLTKEISIVTIPIAAIICFITWVYQKITKALISLSPFIHYFVATVVGGLASYLLRWLIIGRNIFSGSYTHNYVFDLSRIISNSVYWFQLIIRDDAFLFPLLILAAIAIFKNKQYGYGLLMLNFLIWMLGWVSIYFPWVYSAEYYLLPFALGASISGGIAIECSTRLLIESSRWFRIWIGATLALTAILFGATLNNNYANARAELALDAANRKILLFISEHATENSVILINLPPSEYTTEIGLELAEIYGRKDLRVDIFNFQELDRKGQTEYYIISPTFNNSVLTTIRIGVASHPKDWAIDFQTYISQENWGKSIVADYHISLVSFDLASSLCPFIGEKNFCRWHNRPISKGEFIYGWTVYFLEPR